MLVKSAIAPREGQKYHEVYLEGVKFKVLMRREVKKGDDVPEADLELSTQGDCYFLKSERGQGKGRGKGGGGYQREEEVIVAECAYKGQIDLMIAGKIPEVKYEQLLEHTRRIWRAGKALQAINYAKAKGDVKPTEGKPEPKPEAGGLKPIGKDEAESAARDWENATPKDFNNERNRLYNALGWGGDQVKEFLIHEGYPDGVVPLAKRYLIIEHLKARLPKEAK